MLCYTCVVNAWLSHHLRLIGWCTLLLCLWSTGDLVVDLAFEAPETITDLQATTEEPDNAAEHVLMPSARADSSSTDTTATSPTAPVDLVAATPTDITNLNTDFLQYDPPRTVSGSSFSVPLRI